MAKPQMNLPGEMDFLSAPPSVPGRAVRPSMSGRDCSNCFSTFCFRAQRGSFSQGGHRGRKLSHSGG